MSAASLLIAIIAAATTYGVTHTQQQNAATANGLTISQAQVDGFATTIARVHVHDPNYNPPDTTTLVRQLLDYQAAVKAGVDCTPAEAQAELHAIDATAVAQGSSVVLFSIEDSGLAPAGYHLTPEAERTPDTASLIAAYEQNAGVIMAMQRTCAISNLNATVIAGRRAGLQGNDAVATYRAGVYAHATVIGADGKPIDVRQKSGTPVAPG